MQQTSSKSFSASCIDKCNVLDLLFMTSKSLAISVEPAEAGLGMINSLVVHSITTPRMQNAVCVKPNSESTSKLAASDMSAFALSFNGATVS